MTRINMLIPMLLLASIISMAQERLSRGVVVLPAMEEGNFVSWRMLSTDEENTVFDVVRDAQVVASGLKVTNFTDKGGRSNSISGCHAHERKTGDSLGAYQTMD